MNISRNANRNLQPELPAFSYRPYHRPVALLCLVNALLVATIMIVGAITRLTESGLSITEWQLFRGIVPPFTDDKWTVYFNLYQQTPEFRFVNPFMTLAQFKQIFWWEYLHRLLGRAFFLTYVIPLIILMFLRKPWIREQDASGKILNSVPYLPQLVLILFLGGLQGFIGWWMVKSGLVERVDVAPTRLAIHLGMAWVIYAFLVWIALPDTKQTAVATHTPTWLRVFAVTCLVLVAVTSIFGALTAGGKAGFSNTQWPLYPNNSLIPDDYSLMMSNGISIQATHRLLAYFTAAWVLTGSLIAWQKQLWTWTAAALSIGVLGQAAIGVLTLVNAVPIVLGVLHQFGALFILTILIIVLHNQRQHDTTATQ